MVIKLISETFFVHLLWVPMNVACVSNFLIYLFAVVSSNVSLQLLPGFLVENSPGSKPGIKILCERVEIHGLSRLKHLKKFANSIKVKVSCMNQNSHPHNVQVCFHR